MRTKAFPDKIKRQLMNAINRSFMMMADDGSDIVSKVGRRMILYIFSCMSVASLHVEAPGVSLYRIVLNNLKI